MTTDDTTVATAIKPARARRAKATNATAPAPAVTPNATVKPVPDSTVKATSKSDTVIKLLLRAKGATATELIAATDWLPHSLRAFLSGLRKKGRTIVREERKGGGFAYRIVIAPVDTALDAGHDDVPKAMTGSEPPPEGAAGPSDHAAAAATDA